MVVISDAIAFLTAVNRATADTDRFRIALFGNIFPDPDKIPLSVAVVAPFSL